MQVAWAGYSPGEGV